MKKLYKSPLVRCVLIPDEDLIATSTTPMSKSLRFSGSSANVDSSEKGRGRGYDDDDF